MLVPLRVAMIKANHPKMARSTRVDQGLGFSFFIMTILVIIPWPEVNQWDAHANEWQLRAIRQYLRAVKNS